MRTFETAAALYTHGFYDEAMERTEEVILEAPDDGRAWELRGLIHRATGNIPLACDSLEHASLLVPLSTCGQLTLADCFIRLGRKSLALLVAQHVLSRETLEAPLMCYLAHIFERCEQPGVSVEICRLACKKNANYHRAFFDLAYFLGRAGGSPEEIEGAMRRAVRLAPCQPQYRIGLSLIFWRQGRCAAAFREANSLTTEQLALVHCSCCAKALLNIFWNAGDFARSETCAERCYELAARQTSPSSECRS